MISIVKDKVHFIEKLCNFCTILFVQIRLSFTRGGDWRSNTETNDFGGGPVIRCLDMVPLVTKCQLSSRYTAKRTESLNQPRRTLNRFRSDFRSVQCTSV